MDPKSDKPLRLFVNPFTIWSELALKTGEAMLASAHAAAVRAAGPKVAVIPTADAPPPKVEAPKVEAPKVEAPKAEAPKVQLKIVRHASKATRFKASKAKLRSKANGTRRPKR
jgi:hypothetical protein